VAGLCEYGFELQEFRELVTFVLPCEYNYQLFKEHPVSYSWLLQIFSVPYSYAQQIITISMLKMNIIV
jgi:hypothetical protein